jgi:hypothetical protein
VLQPKPPPVDVILEKTESEPGLPLVLLAPEAPPAPPAPTVTVNGVPAATEKLAAVL